MIIEIVGVSCKKFDEMYQKRNDFRTLRTRRLAIWDELGAEKYSDRNMEFDDMPHYMSDENQKERLKKKLNALYGMKEEEKDHG